MDYFTQLPNTYYIKYKVSEKEHFIQQYVYQLNIVNVPQIIYYDEENKIMIMKKVLISALFCLGLSGMTFSQGGELESIREKYSNAEFIYDTLPGIGYEAGCTRRDPSDVIKVGDTCYVYYTKIYGVSPDFRVCTAASNWRKVESRSRIRTAHASG